MRKQVKGSVTVWYRENDSKGVSHARQIQITEVDLIIELMKSVVRSGGAPEKVQDRVVSIIVHQTDEQDYNEIEEQLHGS